MDVLSVVRDPPAAGARLGALRPLPPPPSSGTWLVRWDGSFQTAGAAVGVTVGRLHSEGGPVLSVGVPVLAHDASRAEALGPALAALLLQALPANPVIFEGDSRFVVQLLNREVPARDIFLFNCSELVFDLVHRWSF